MDSTASGSIDARIPVRVFLSTTDRRLVIEEDSSDKIDISEVDGDTLVYSDGSGLISMRGHDGDFTVRLDGSGDIRAPPEQANVPGDDRAR